LNKNSTNQNLTIYANNTLNEISSKIVNWEYILYFDDLNTPFDSINTTTYETKTERYELDFRMNTSKYKIQDVELLSYTLFGFNRNYGFIPSVTYYQNRVVMNQTIDMPLESNNKGVLKENDWWISVVYLNSSYREQIELRDYNNYDQDMYNISMGSCGVPINGKNFMNITVYDVNTLVKLTDWNIGATIAYYLGTGETFTTLGKTYGGYKSFNINNDSTNYSLICVNSSTNTKYKLTGIIQYSKPGYQPNTFYFTQTMFNASFMNNLSLYLLPVENSTTFIMQVNDYNQIPIPNYFVYVKQCDVSNLSNCRIVQVIQTDNSGQGPVFLQPETVYYVFDIYDNYGNFVYGTDPRPVTLQSTPYKIIITIPSTQGNPLSFTQNVTGIDYSLTYNKLTQIVTYNWYDTNSSFSFAQLIVTKSNASGLSYYICNTTSSSSWSTMTCNVTG
jgi:hypothetical protein